MNEGMWVIVVTLAALFIPVLVYMYAYKSGFYSGCQFTRETYFAHMFGYGEKVADE